MGAEQMGLWVYCVIENKGLLTIEAMGIHGTSPVFVVAHGDFAMVVSKEPMKKYPLIRDILIAHQLVNEKVMQIQPVLPVKFCTMAEDENQIVEEVLKQKDKVQEFRKAVDEIRGKAEFGLRVRWKDLDKILANLPHEDERLKTAKENILKLSDRESHSALIEIGHIVKEALEKKNEKTADTLMEALIPYSAQHKRNNVLGDMNILNGAFLVEESKQEKFDAVVNDLVTKYESEIQLKYVGPTPPFNFIEIVIRWADKSVEGKKEV